LFREKIEKSNAINQARLRLLKAREEVLNEAVEQASGKLAKLGDPKDPKYKQMLQDLILQVIERTKRKSNLEFVIFFFLIFDLN
jgi:vacuolar-type H+-ATPase subunit E/Vma4